MNSRHVSDRDLLDFVECRESATALIARHVAQCSPCALRAEALAVEAQRIDDLLTLLDDPVPPRPLSGQVRDRRRTAPRVRGLAAGLALLVFAGSAAALAIPSFRAQMNLRAWSADPPENAAAPQPTQAIEFAPAQSLDVRLPAAAAQAEVWVTRVRARFVRVEATGPSVVFTVGDDVVSIRGVDPGSTVSLAVPSRVERLSIWLGDHEVATYGQGHGTNSDVPYRIDLATGDLGTP